MEFSLSQSKGHIAGHTDLQFALRIRHSQFDGIDRRVASFCCLHVARRELSLIRDIEHLASKGLAREGVHGHGGALAEGDLSVAVLRNINSDRQFLEVCHRHSRYTWLHELAWLDVAGEDNAIKRGNH